MIPLIKRLIHTFLFNEGAVVGWIRGTMLTFAVSGVAFADQLSELIGAPGYVKTIKVVAIICGFIGGVIRAGEMNAKPQPPKDDGK